ncbi:protein kintoun-like [Myxocyprinus asiaticus]|uniref:protein kintoun-like n=1 Tax=Myxocyprinus asiaticus TaxID=70543 RepID=UPI00222146D8|nr:protein kintoun-like [Myxocyprinus asiaticus]
MAFGSKLQELNLTRDEMNRFGEALKKESFRALLNEYAAEISNPENKRQYEEEIKQLEEERGMNVQFIHPESHHVLKTSSAHGKCFINICSNQLIDKPSCAAATDTDGKTGYNWSLPFSLTPGRPDRDAKGNTCVIYDVVYHPDAIHMAENNSRFMNMINSTAIRGIEDSFQIKLNRNTKQLQMRYKGIPHPAVIRRPIPEHVEKKRSSGEDGLSFPYPDQTRPKPDQTGPKPDQTGPKPDQTRPKPDQTGPKPDQTGPKPDQTRPKPDQTGPKPDQTRPKPDQTRPKPDQTEPKPDQTKPDQTGPKPDQTRPKADQTKADQTRPKSDQTRPKPDQTRPKADQTKADQTKPKPDQTRPKPDQTRPKPDQTKPKPDQTGPKPDQTGPKPDQTRPKPDQTGPKPDQTGPKPDQTRCSVSKQPIIPHYTLRYRSVLDLQECFSTRPKHIIIIIDLPLLRSAHDVHVSVTERRLVLESQTASYKLDLLLSYPVHEDKGHAKFNKTNKQLTITLPVVAVKNPVISQSRRDDDDEERKIMSDDEAEEKPHEDTEKPCETDHTESNTHDSALVTCAVSELDRFNLTSEPQLINLLKETHTTDTGDNVMINPTVIRTEPEESDHFHHTCAPEIQNMGTEEDPSDFDINLHEMSVSGSQIQTSATPDDEVHNTSDREQETPFEPNTDERPGAFSQETTMTHEDERKYPVTSSYEQLNACETEEQETKHFSEEPSAPSQYDEAVRSVTSMEETGVSSKDPADTSNPPPVILRETDPDDRELIVCDHKIFCFQNTLCFDLD